MDMKYIKLRQQLDELGYKDSFPLEGITLVEKLTADLIQTTKSLQHYMTLSKDIIKERDGLKAAADPYICDNSKLVKENNRLHCDLLQLQEDYDACMRRAKNKIKKLENCTAGLEFENRNLKNRCRDHELSHLRADTISSRSKNVYGFTRPCCIQENQNGKTSRDACACSVKQCCICLQLQQQVDELCKSAQDYKDKQSQLNDDADFLKSQICNRDKENARLIKLLEGGRPVEALQRDCCGKDLDRKMLRLSEEVRESEKQTECYKSQLEEALEKQHEAMTRAIHLSDKNQQLEKELKNIDRLALKIESQSNESLKDKNETILILQQELEISQKNYAKLEKELFSIRECQRNLQAQLEANRSENAALNSALDESNKVKQKLVKENKVLLGANRKLEVGSDSQTQMSGKSAKEEVLKLLEKERQLYERQISEVKKQLEEVTRFKQRFDKGEVECHSCEQLKLERDFFRKESRGKMNPSEGFVAELKNKICELEQNIQALHHQRDMLTDSNISLKSIIEQNRLARKNYREPQVEAMQMSFNKLERDLQGAFCEIRNLKEERDRLRYKLSALVARERQPSPQISHVPYFDQSPIYESLKHDIDILHEKLRTAEAELLHVKALNNQLKTLQIENDKNISSAQAQSYEYQKQIQRQQEQIRALEKSKSDLEQSCHLLKSDKVSLRDSVTKIDLERDKLIVDIDEKTEKVSGLEHELRSKSLNIEMHENKINELNKKIEMLTNINTDLEHRWRDSQTRNEAISTELDAISKQRDNAIIENKRLQGDLARVSGDLKTMNREYEMSRKEVEQMKQQLQHYVDEVRRIEDILSRKEAERTEMLDHFASLSHEATVLESNNHCLENEAATKNAQLHTSLEKLKEMENKLDSRESLIDLQEEKMTKLVYAVSNLESELRQQKELTRMAELNLQCARETCATLEKLKKSILIGVGETDTEKKKLEFSYRVLRDEKIKLEEMHTKDRASIESLESLLNCSRREVVELKLHLQEAIEEISELKAKVEELHERLRKVEGLSSNSRQRAEEAAKNLQDLQLRMNDQRFQRARASQQSSKHCHGGTL